MREYYALELEQILGSQAREGQERPLQLDFVEGQFGGGLSYIHGFELDDVLGAGLGADALGKFRHPKGQATWQILPETAPGSI